MDSLPPIPTPAAQRWREFRIQVLPVIVLVCTMVAIALMWRSFVQASRVTGEVEAVKAKSAQPRNGVAGQLGPALPKTIIRAFL